MQYDHTMMQQVRAGCHPTLPSDTRPCPGWQWQ